MPPALQAQTAEIRKYAEMQRARMMRAAEIRERSVGSQYWRRVYYRPPLRSGQRSSYEGMETHLVPSWGFVPYGDEVRIDYGRPLVM